MYLINDFIKSEREGQFELECHNTAGRVLGGRRYGFFGLLRPTQRADLLRQSALCMTAGHMG